MVKKCGRPFGHLLSRQNVKIVQIWVRFEDFFTMQYHLTISFFLVYIYLQLKIILVEKVGFIVYVKHVQGKDLLVCNGNASNWIQLLVRTLIVYLNRKISFAHPVNYTGIWLTAKCEALWWHEMLKNTFSTRNRQNTTDVQELIF